MNKGHPQRNESKCHLRVKDLVCTRDDRTLFSNLSFTLNPGGVVQIEGDNGSGKTTLIRVLCGLLMQESGEVFWKEENIQTIRYEYYAELGYMGHTHGLKEELTALENLKVVQLLGSSKGYNLHECLDKTGLTGYEYARVATLSAGQKRRLAMARLLANQPLVWILDEPFTALDKSGIKMFEELMDAHCSNGGLLILTTHHKLTLNTPVSIRIDLSQ